MKCLICLTNLHNIKNTGDKAVDLKYVTIKRTDENKGDAANEQDIKGLRLFDSSGNKLSLDTEGVGCSELKADGDSKIVTIELKDALRLAKGETKTFEVKVGATDKMSDGHSLSLQLVPEETYYRKAGGIEDLKISIDNDKEVGLGTVRAKD